MSRLCMVERVHVSASTRLCLGFCSPLVASGKRAASVEYTVEGQVSLEPVTQAMPDYAGCAKWARLRTPLVRQSSAEASLPSCFSSRQANPSSKEPADTPSLATQRAGPFGCRITSLLLRPRVFLKTTDHYPALNHERLLAWKEKDFGTMEPGPLTGLSLRATLRESPDGLSARQLLFLARRIASIATGGFRFFHDRCMSINAEHLADASSEYLQPPRGFPWSQRFEGRPYRPESGGPPSWYEMQHMTRGLWNLQVIYEVRNAAKEGRLGWTAHDVEQIWAMDVNAWFGHPTVYSEEVLTALYYVHHLEGKPLADSCIGHPFSAPSTGPLGEYPLQLPKPWASTTGEVNALGETTNVWPADVPHPPRGDFRARFGFEAYGYKWAQLLSQNVRSPIRTVSFRPFRALGFGLWDRQRLVAFGLVDAPPGELAMMMAPKTTGDFFAWRSWLDEGAKAEIEARQEGEWRSGRMGGLLRITGCS
ncbi:uncharacterized protein VDAG_02626 [Verticillium dahliae VdLs.17]|uniref:Uncharacterized protein n=1 Tax=Verticillium dahliae (strain VdLs.17 / ATCC MYA-4575 / FGSC 10137) TaxID=498257 RepID=G2WYE4_VERDV|nr:uncharacterized protein VDAG_02626 [Verticillium dahliae VdLs.17]EGY21102.1 hypothetical protein VDAG_02626 [Verticillium dahliae VdLs.17]KAH6707076.1 hypothetical protein EV126DRAFT_333524 [Verticillium dahliae]